MHPLYSQTGRHHIYQIKRTLQQHLSASLVPCSTTITINKTCHFINMTIIVTESMFYDLGMRLLNRFCMHRSESGDRSFRSFFGVCPSVVFRCWNLLNVSMFEMKGAQPVHLLWTCMFLKLYGPESTLSAIAKCSDKTYRKWIWNMIYAISQLESQVVRASFNISTAY